MSSIHHYKTLLAQLRSQVEERQRDRRHQRVEGRRIDKKSAKNASPDIQLSADVLRFFKGIQAAVLRDSRRYFEAQETVLDGVLPLDATSTDVNTLYLRPLFDGWMLNRHFDTTTPTPGLSHAVGLCHAFMQQELDNLVKEQTARGAVVAPALVNKIKQAVAAFSNGRTSDTVTLLKNALGGDPHNHMLLAMLSQVLYLLAANGQQTTLPEAREFAQRSTIFSEKINAERLLYYRYLAIVSELAFSPEKAMLWLRETGLLDVVPLKGREGLFAERGMCLRAWAILGLIPPGLWSEHEYILMLKLVSEISGGGAVYLTWLRPGTLEIIRHNKSPLPEIERLEGHVYTAYMNYQDVGSHLRQMPLTTSANPWLLRVRYLNTFSTVVTPPHLDQVLCMVSLDTHSFREHISPDPALREQLDDSTLSYWQLWACSITPLNDARLPYLMPAAETVQDAPMLTTCDQLLQALKELENARINTQLWPDLQPWMNKWNMEHLLAAGTGSNKPRTRFSPNLAPYTHFYRRWSEKTGSSTLASEVIESTAKLGAFASFYEVVSAFDGALRLLDDPRFGLVTSQRKALATAKKNDPKKFGGFSINVSGGGQMGMMLLFPAALVGAVALILKMSANASQSAGLILALGGLAGLVAVNLRR